MGGAHPTGRRLWRDFVLFVVEKAVAGCSLMVVSQESAKPADERNSRQFPVAGPRFEIRVKPRNPRRIRVLSPRRRLFVGWLSPGSF